MPREDASIAVFEKRGGHAARGGHPGREERASDAAVQCGDDSLGLDVRGVIGPGVDVLARVRGCGLHHHGDDV